MSSKYTQQHDFKNTVGDLPTSVLTNRIKNAARSFGITDAIQHANDFKLYLYNSETTELLNKFPDINNSHIKIGDTIGSADCMCKLVSVSAFGYIDLEYTYNSVDNIPPLLYQFNINAIDDPHNFPLTDSETKQLIASIKYIHKYKVTQRVLRQHILNGSSSLLSVLDKIAARHNNTIIEPSITPRYIEGGDYTIRFNSDHIEAHSSAFTENTKTMNQVNKLINSLLINMTKTPIDQWMNKINKKEFDCMLWTDESNTTKSHISLVNVTHQSVGQRWDLTTNSFSLKLLLKFTTYTNTSPSSNTNTYAPLIIGKSNIIHDIPIDMVELVPRTRRKTVSAIVKPNNDNLSKPTQFIEMWVQYCADGEKPDITDEHRCYALKPELIVRTMYPSDPTISIPENPIDILPSPPPEIHTLLHGLHNGGWNFVWSLPPKKMIEFLYNSVYELVGDHNNIIPTAFIL